jgi:hypothetical protein
MVQILFVVIECFVRLGLKLLVVNKQLNHQLSAYQYLVEKELDVPDVKLKETKNLDVDK